MTGQAGIDIATTLLYFIRKLLLEIKAVVKTHALTDLNTAYTKAKLYEQGRSKLKHFKKTKKYVSSSFDSDSDSFSKNEKSR
jgi:hypothetical protein